QRSVPRRDEMPSAGYRCRRIEQPSKPRIARLRQSKEARQPQRDIFERNQQRQDYGLTHQEPPATGKYLPQRDLVPHQRLRRKDVQAHRRSNQADLQQLDHQDAEPDQVRPKRLQRRNEYRQRQQHDADRLHEASQYQVHDYGEVKQAQEAAVRLPDERRDEVRQAAAREESRHTYGADGIEEDGRRDVQ